MMKLKRHGMCISQKGIFKYVICSAALENNLPPYFENRVNVIINEPMMKCFDVEFITSDVLVVDCAEEKPPVAEAKVPMDNYFYIIRKNDTPEIAKKNRVLTTNYKGYD